MKKYNITVNGTTYEVIVEEVEGGASRPSSYTPPAAPIASSAPKSTKSPASSAVGGISVVAPMPGTILEMKVSLGQSVKKGETICVLEAMKMENDIPAPCDGVVVSVNVQKGGTVAANDVIVSLN